MKIKAGIALGVCLGVGGVMGGTTAFADTASPSSTTSASPSSETTQPTTGPSQAPATWMEWLVIHEVNGMALTYHTVSRGSQYYGLDGHAVVPLDAPFREIVDFGDGVITNSYPSAECSYDPGPVEFSNTSDSVTHTYSKPGTYRVTVTLTYCSGIPGVGEYGEKPLAQTFDVSVSKKQTPPTSKPPTGTSKPGTASRPPATRMTTHGPTGPRSTARPTSGSAPVTRSATSGPLVSTDKVDDGVGPGSALAAGTAVIAAVAAGGVLVRRRTR